MLRTAQIGLGWWGSQVAKVLKGSDKIQIVCGVDPAPAVAEKFTRAHGLPVVTGYQEVLDDPSIEAVILTIPHRLHEEALLAAAAAGKQVFCEKPLALTVESARRMIEACDRAGIVLGIGHERRFEPAWEEMKRMADAGELGTILHMEAQWSHDRWLNMAADNWRGSKEEAPAAGWTGMGVHLSDMMLSLVQPVVEVEAYTAKRILAIPTGDVVSVHLRFADGTTGHIAAVSATPDYARFAVFGSHAWAEARETQHVDPGGTTNFYVRRRGDTRQACRDFEPASPVRAGYEHWADAVAGRTAYRFSNAERLGNVAVLEAVARSAESGRPEPVAQYS
ncbi:MAG: Gfo/Idh/MocA family oxidoreductase [Acidimicrobiia bacterium]|jgi:predicted dehydrogenase|nr:Gfo/Idh/MocA family oxidoreductase [Acidimicrobiia bacterium]